MKWLIPVILAVVAMWSWDVSRRLELGKQVSYSKTDMCQVLRGPLAAEDIVKWRNHVLTSNLDTLTISEYCSKDPSELIHYSANSAPSGSIYVITGIGSTSEPTIEPALVEGFPSDVAFRPHGLGLLADGDLLFVVNHAYARGGERIDIFHLLEEEKVRLVYKSTVRFDECCMGTLNDVVPISAEEFYVTKSFPSPDPISGKPATPKNQIFNFLYFFNPFGIKMTSIFYCNKSTGSYETVCKQVGPKGIMWNGITEKPDSDEIFVCDTNDKTIVAFKRSPDGSLTHSRTYHLEDYGDNIFYDPEDGQIWFSGKAQMASALRYLSDFLKHPGSVPKGGPSPSGLLSAGHVSSLDPETGKVTVHLTHDGSMLGSASAGIKFGNHVVMSSWVDDGVLFCPLE